MPSSIDLILLLDKSSDVRFPRLLNSTVEKIGFKESPRVFPLKLSSVNVSYRTNSKKQKTKH